MNRILVGLCGGLVFLLCAPSGLAQQGETAVEETRNALMETSAVPRLVRFTGALRTAEGPPVRGLAARLTFSIYAEQNGGAALWSESQDVALDEHGRYSVLLGAMSDGGLPAEVFSANGARWLGIQEEGRDEGPRILLVAVPYALKAADAESLGGKPAAAYALQGQSGASVLAVGGAAKSDAAQAPALTSPTGTQPNAVVSAGQTHFIDTTSDYVVRVTQNGTGRGLYGLSQTGEAVYGQILGTSGTTYGVRGLTPSTTGAGVFGQSTATTGAAYGVRGNSSSTAGAGVAGFNTATTGSAIGVIGQTSSSSGVGLFGRALAATGATVGIQGIADSTSGTGINAQATAASGTTTGLFAKVNSATGTALIVDNAGGGKIASFRNNGVEQASISGTGIFTGNGSGLTNVNAVLLGNVAAANYPQLNFSNTGSLTLTGALTSKGLAVTPDVTDTSGGPTYIGTNILAGHAGNLIAPGTTGATIAGGGGTINGSLINNAVTDDWGTVGGGLGNRAGDNSGTRSDRPYATVGGGGGNLASGERSTVGGGYSNYAGGFSATVAGGSNNNASVERSTVGGGYNNNATGAWSTVAGGSNNTASGFLSTVAGGSSNIASGTGSFAAGSGANAAHAGAFVWADQSSVNALASTAPNQFLIRAAGGVSIGTNNPGGAMLAVAGNVTASGVITGDGSGLTSLNSTNLTGTVPLALISGLTNANISGGIAATKISGTAATLAATTNVFNGNIQVGSALVVDQPGFNNGTGVNPGLTFGGGSGEGIASNRTNGANGTRLLHELCAPAEHYARR